MRSVMINYCDMKDNVKKQKFPNCTSFNQSIPSDVCFRAVQDTNLVYLLDNLIYGV